MGGDLLKSGHASHKLVHKVNLRKNLILNNLQLDFDGTSCVAPWH